MSSVVGEVLKSSPNEGLSPGQAEERRKVGEGDNNKDEESSTDESTKLE